MKRTFSVILALLAFASNFSINSANAYSKEQAKKHAKIAAKLITGVISTAASVNALSFQYQNLDAIQVLLARKMIIRREDKLLLSLHKSTRVLFLVATILAGITLKSAYDDIKSEVQAI